MAIAAAAFEVVDTPIEGFDPDCSDEILGLREKGKKLCYTSVGYVMLKTIGYQI
jgi:hypothetical protein